MSPEFWQQLLATDASAERLWLLAEEAKAVFSSGLPLSDLPGLTDAERRNIGATSRPTERVNVAEQSPSTGVPPALFVRGDAACLHAPKVGIVGTRGASPYGKSVARLFASSVAQGGCTVLSGGAIGVDTCVHEAVLEARGRTVAVLPCGVDVSYPSRNRALFDQITQHGCVVSQFPCGAGLREHWLPRRNILLAGLSDVLVVVEAPAKSGSLMTARAALEAEKPVFVVPGPITQASFAGSHDLIRNGGVLVDDPGQVLATLGLSQAPKIKAQVDRGSPESAVLSALSGTSLNVEAICSESGLKVDAVLTALTMLEIDGFVERSGDGYALKP